MAFETLEGISISHRGLHKFDGTVEEVKPLRAKKTGKPFIGLRVSVSFVDSDGDTDTEILDVNLFGDAYKKAKSLKLEPGRRVWLKGRGSVRSGDTNPDVRFCAVNIEAQKGIRVTPWSKKER